MKGFIEVTQPNENKVLLNVDRIYNVMKGTGSDTSYYKTTIESDKANMVACKETYDEVKALIAEAQGETEPKPMLSKLEEWKDTFKVLRDIKKECISREVCDDCFYYESEHCCPFAKILTYTIPKYWDLDDFPEGFKP